MPELPEVETIRADLAPLVRGRTIEAVQVDPGTAQLLLGGISTADFAAALRGRRIAGLGRRGKYLRFALDDGARDVSRRALVQMQAHLGITAAERADDGR